MTQKGLRGFASGMLVATSVWAIFHFTSTKEVPISTEIPATTFTSEEMKTILEDTGYIVLSEEEYNELLNTEREIVIEVIDEKPTVEKEVEQVFYAYISIQPGMTSSQVATQLERAKIIQSREMFITYMEQNNLNGSIKIGEYQLHSGMTIEEIAIEIT